MPAKYEKHYNIARYSAGRFQLFKAHKAIDKLDKLDIHR